MDLYFVRKATTQRPGFCYDLSNYLKSQPVISRTSPGEVTEKEVVAKIIELRKSEGYNGKVVKCYCRIGYAAINPSYNFV